jgi:hypothetical protein
LSVCLEQYIIERRNIKPEKEGKLAVLLILHIAPYVIVDLPLLLSKQSEV